MGLSLNPKGFWAQADTSDKYELATNNLAQLDLDANIYSFLLSQNASLAGFPVILKPKERENQKLEELSQEAIVNPFSSIADMPYKSDMLMETKKVIKVNPEKVFFKMYPRFRRYCDPKKHDLIQQRKQRLLNLFSDSHCLLYFLLIPILCITTQEFPNYLELQSLHESFEESLKITSAHEKANQVVTKRRDDLESIKTFSQFFTWLESAVVYIFGEEEGELKEAFEDTNILLNGLTIQAVMTCLWSFK